VPVARISRRRGYGCGASLTLRPGGGESLCRRICHYEAKLADCCGANLLMWLTSETQGTHTGRTALVFKREGFREES
jgi:hypothetical protein